MILLLILSKNKNKNASSKHLSINLTLTFTYHHQHYLSSINHIYQKKKKKMSIKTSISIKTLQLQFKTLIQSWPIDRLRSHQSSLQFSNALSQIFNRFNLKFQDSNPLNSGVHQTHQLEAFNGLIETLQRIKDNRISSNVSFLSLFYYLDIA